MKILITGGAGFIGSNLAIDLLKCWPDCQVILYDNLKSGTLRHLESIINDNRVRFIKEDVHNLDILVQSMEGVEVVFHLAANPDISKAETDPVLDFREGTLLTQNVLEGVRINKVKHIIFTSGSGVYGEVKGQVFAEAYGPCFPVSPYGAAKLGSEALISAYCHMFGIHGIAFRFANVVGPNQTHGVGFDFLNKLSQNRHQLKILGDGTQRKSYIFISDVLGAIKTVMNQNCGSRKFDVYNIATQDYITVSEISLMACEALGIDKNKVDFIYTGGDRGWNGDVPQVLFDSGKIRNLGWRNEYTSREAMMMALEAMAKLNHA